MFVLGDEGHYHGRFPWVTTALVTLCVAIYTLQSLIGEPFTNGFSLVPAEISEVRDLKGTEYAKIAVPAGRTYRYQSVPVQHYAGPAPIYLTFFTYMFLHGGLGHLLGNVWFLIVFGRNVECALGHARFLIFYLMCGMMAGAVQVVSEPHSIIPCLGASGAISGVLGAYVAIHPFNKVKLWMIGLTVDLPALLVIGFWFLMQYLSVCLALEDPGHADNVAYWAHIGGFVTGLALIQALILVLKAQVAAEKTKVVCVPVEAVEVTMVDPFSTFMPPPLPAESLSK